MKVYTCFMLFGIFAHTNSTTRNRTKVYQRSINPPENISKLSSKEYSGDTKNLDNAHHFIAKETTTTDKKKNKNHVFKTARVKTFTDFIQEAINMLNTYEDTAFEDFFHILDPEIRRYHYKDCKFSELTQNPDTRSLLAEALIKIRGKTVSFMKANINEMADMMRDKTYGNEVIELLNYVNSLYRHTEPKFHRVLKELKHYGKLKSIKAHKNLIMVIRHGLRDILFDHYTALDSNIRRKLKERIEKFWKQFKKNPAPSVEENDSHEMNDAISKSVISSIKVSEDVMNEDKYPELHSKNDPQTNLRNKRYRKSKEEYYQQPPDKETEKDDSSSESEKQNTDTDTLDEVSSGQSIDSSSNSIKQSQERHAEYNTDRYMTLYFEKISYKSTTAKKTKIIPISANEMIKKATVPRRATTTTAQRYSTEDESVRLKKADVLRSNHKPDDIKLRISYSDHDTESVVTVKSKPKLRRIQGNKQRRLSTPDKLKSSTHENVQVIGEYNAVIDVQLANTELLKSLGISQPVPDNNFRYDTISYQRSVKQTKPVPARPTIQFRRMQAEAETKSRKPALTKPPSGYSKTQEPIYLNRLSKTRRNKLTLLPKDDDFIRKQKLKYLTMRNTNDTGLNVPKNFKEYIIKRLDTLEHDLKDFRSMLHDNHTHEVEVSNVTDMYKAKNKTENKRKVMKDDVVRLNIGNHDLNEKEHNEENNDGHSTKSNIMNTESSTNNTSSNPNVTKKITLNTTVIDNDNKNTSQVTSNSVNDNKQSNKDKIDNSETTVTVNGTVKVTDSKEFEDSETTPATTRTKLTTFDYSDLRYELAHFNDGMNLGM